MASLFQTKKRKLVIIILLISSSLFLVRDTLTNSLQQVFLANEDKKDEIIILYTNNEHGAVGNFARIAAKKERLKEQYKDVFLVSTGNIFSGDLIVDQYRKNNQDMRGKPMIKLMNLAGYDLLNLGRYDFDYGQKILQENIAQADFPVLTSNFEVSSQSDLAEIKSDLIVKTESGIEILFLGLMDLFSKEDNPLHEQQFYGLRNKKLSAITNQYSQIEAETDLMIALSNLEYQNQIKLAESINNLDLIISGDNKENLESAKKINNSLITQAGCRTNFLGKIKITLLEDNVDEIDLELIAISEIREEQKEVKEVIYDYRQESKEIMREVITTLEEGIKQKEKVANLVTDAIRKEFNLDVVLHNLGGIRNIALEKDILIKDIYQLLPFSEEILIFSVSKKELKEILSKSYQQRGEIDLSISGIEYDIILDQAGELKEIKLKDKNGETITEDQSYKLGLNKQVVLRYNLEEKFDNSPRSISQRATTDIVIDYLYNNDINLNQVSETRIKIETKANNKKINY